MAPRPHRAHAPCCARLPHPLPPRVSRRRGSAARRPPVRRTGGRSPGGGHVALPTRVLRQRCPPPPPELCGVCVCVGNDVTGGGGGRTTWSPTMDSGEPLSPGAPAPQHGGPLPGGSLPWSRGAPPQPRCLPRAQRLCPPGAWVPELALPCRPARVILQGLATGLGVRGLSSSPDPDLQPLPPAPPPCSGTAPRCPAECPRSPVRQCGPGRGPCAASVCAGAQLPACGLCHVLGATFGLLCREGGRDCARPLEATAAPVGPGLPSWDTGSCSRGQGKVKVPCFPAPQALQNRNGSTERETCAMTQRSGRFRSVWRLGLWPLPVPASKVFRNLPGADAQPG